jgi:hypothetical protein
MKKVFLAMTAEVPKSVGFVKKAAGTSVKH